MKGEKRSKARGMQPSMPTASRRDLPSCSSLPPPPFLSRLPALPTQPRLAHDSRLFFSSRQIHPRRDAEERRGRSQLGARAVLGEEVLLTGGLLDVVVIVVGEVEEGACGRGGGLAKKGGKE